MRIPKRDLIDVDRKSLAGRILSRTVWGNDSVRVLLLLIIFLSGQASREGVGASFGVLSFTLSLVFSFSTRALLFGIGAFFVGYFSHALRIPPVAVCAEHPAEIVGMLQEVSFRAQGEAAILVRTQMCGEPTSVLLFSGALPWNPRLEEGMMIAASGKLKPLPSSLTPWDSSASLRRRGVSAILFAKTTELFPGKPEPQLRRKLLLRLPQESLATPVLAAAVLGDDSLLTLAERDLFRNTGTTHLIVVSGFHINLIFFAAAACFRWIWGRSQRLLILLPGEVPAALFGLLVATAYVALTGWELPSARALVAGGVLALSRIVARRQRFSFGLLLAVFAVSMVWPGAIFEVGFQLTFAALIGLQVANALSGRFESSLQVHLIERSVRPRLARLREVTLQKLLSAVLVSLATWGLTSPILYLHFESFVPIAPLVNLLGGPLFTFLCLFPGIGAVFAVALGLPGGQLLYSAAAWGTLCFLRFLSLFHRG